MAEQKLNGLRVAVLATDGFEEAELIKPKQALEAAGAQVSIIAPKSGEIYGMKHHDKAGKIKVDLTLDEASPKDFDAVLLPGGGLNADALRAEKKAQEFIQEIDGAQKPIAVICHAPWLLISARLTRGRTLTSWPSIKDDLVNAGAQWQDQEVLVDDNWVSSRKPDDIPAFNREMISLFAERLPQKKVA